MKRLLPLLFILLFLVACASQRGNVVSSEGREWTAESLPQQVVPAPPPIAKKPTKADQATPEKVKPKSNKALAEKGPVPDPSFLENRQGLDPDENIASLLEPDYLRQFDIPIVFNDAVEYYIKWYCTEKRKVFTNWLRRSHKYVPLIKEILREQGMPEDLIYLAMIESGFHPGAYSPAKACGPWQFIYATGERYGLRVDHWVDERRDPEKSTVAAARYLRDLFNQFGCWYLAAAGYNAGEKRIERAIEKHDTSDWWELSKYNTLPRETREYIPKLIAAAIVAKDPERFGFTGIAYEEPIRFVTRKVPRATPLSALAKAASTDVLVIRGLNPELVRGITPPNREYAVKLPFDVNVKTFDVALAHAMEGRKTVEGVMAYKMKKKESLAKVMKRYKVTQEDLALVNSCDGDYLRVKQGKVVYIPKFGRTGEGETQVADEKRRGTESKKQLAKALKSEVASGVKTKTRAQVDRNERSDTEGLKAAKSKTQSPQQTYHTVKKGDTLESISERYGVSVASLKEMNRLKKDQIHPNMKLQLVAKGQAAAKPAKRFHVVKKGETLSDIAEKYGTDVSTLKGLNKLKKDRVNAGMKLKVAA